MKKRILVLVSILAAAHAVATVGSVISSFKFVNGGTSGYPYGLERGLDCLYVMMDTVQYSYPYYTLQKYSAAGAFQGEVRLPEERWCRGLAPCHLGAGYLATLEYEALGLAVFNVNNGSFVYSFAASAPGGGRAWDLAWDGKYYYVTGQTNLGEFRRYTSSGSFAGVWVPSGWPAELTSTGGIAFAHRFKNRSGDYLVCGSGTPNQPAFALNCATGARVGSWFIPHQPWRSGGYGNSSQPQTYGAACWVLAYPGYYEGNWIYEIDIDARDADAIAPASLGQMKAIYR